MDGAANLVEAVAALVAALAWPVLLVLLLLYVKRSLDSDMSNDARPDIGASHGPRNVVQRFVTWFGSGRNQAIQLGPFSLSREAAHEVVESAVQLAVVDQQRAGQPLGDEDIKRIVDLVIGGIRQPSKARGLWVDTPNKNRSERAALKPSVDFALAQSNAQAIEMLKDDHGTYDVVISNWTRDDGGAMALLSELAALEHRPPVVIYAGLQDEARVSEAVRMGAFGYTTRPRELYELVTRAIETRRRH